MRRIICIAVVLSMILAMVPFMSVSAADGEYSLAFYGQSGTVNTEEGTGVFVGANGNIATNTRAATSDADGNATAHSGSATVGSSRAGVLTFVVDNMKSEDLRSAVLKLNILGCNHTIDSNMASGTGWMKLAVYETDNNKNLNYLVGGMAENTFAAKNNDYSTAATMWSNERIYRIGGDATVDVTRAVVNALDANNKLASPEDKVTVVLRLQAPVAAYTVDVSAQNGPKLVLTEGVETSVTVKFVEEEGRSLAESVTMDRVFVGDSYTAGKKVVPDILEYEGVNYSVKSDSIRKIKSLSANGEENIITIVYEIAGDESVLYSSDFNEGSDMWSSSDISDGALVVGKDASSASSVMMLESYAVPDRDAERISVKARVKVDNLSAGFTFAVLDADSDIISAASIHPDYKTLCVRSFGSTGARGYYGVKDAVVNQWYDIEFVYHPAIRRYHVYFDGEMAMSSLGYQTGGNVSGLKIEATNGAVGNVYLDSVSVTRTNVRMVPQINGIDMNVMKGEKISLPEFVTVNYEDRFVDVWQVEWEDYPSVAADAGTTKVKGNALGMYSREYSNTIEEAVEAVITVRGISETAFYVDPETGSDSNSGLSEDEAFKTIERARDAVREVNSDMTGDIYVYLAGGVYYVKDPLTFTWEDSGTNGYKVHYSALPGAEPVISGGKRIEGWEKVPGKNYFVADVKASDGFDTYFRQIYVNDERAIRASGGWFSGLSFKRSEATGRPIGLIVDSSVVKDYEDTSDLRLWKAAGFKMDEYRIYDIEKNNDGTTTLYTYSEEDGLFSWREGGLHFAATENWMIVNAFEELNNPGEWWRDTVNEKIYYYPYNDQSVDNIEVIAPVGNTDQLLRVEGNAERKAENIVIEGITFKYSNWFYPEKFAIGGSQAEALWGQYGAVEDISYGYEIPGAVRLNHTNNIEFLNNTIGHTAGVGIHIYNDASNTRIEGNVTYDTTGAGIQVARFGGAYLNDDRTETDSFDETNPEGRVRDTLIKNNYVSDTGRDFFQSTGININASLRNTILHNTLVNCSYMGIHTRMEVVGQYLTRVDSKYINPGTDTTLDIGQNVIAYNYTGQTAWSGAIRGIYDNASIYNFGPSSGTFIARNYIEPTSAQWGLYCDNNSHNIIWRDNVTHQGNVRSNRLVDTHNVVLGGNNSSADPLGLKTLAGMEADISERAVLPQVHPDYVTYRYINLTDAKVLEEDGLRVKAVNATGTNNQAIHPPIDALDGNLETYWGSGRNFPEKLNVEFEEQSLIDKIDLNWYGDDGRKYKYKVYLSNDNKSWTLVIDNSSVGASGFISHSIAPMNAKYIRLDVTGTTSSWGSAALYELVAYKPAAKVLSYNEGRVEVYAGEEVQATVVFAAYDDKNILLSTESKSVTLNAGENIVESETFSDAGSKSIKVMVWDDFDTMRPIDATFEK